MADPFTIEVLIIAYRQFVSPLTFFNILIIQYPLKHGLAHTLEAHKTLKRFLALLNLWLSKYLQRDFLVNNEKGNRLWDSLQQFLLRLSKDGYPQESNQLKLLMLRVRAQPKPPCTKDEQLTMLCICTRPKQNGEGINRET